jgi:hypothetical protein
VSGLTVERAVDDIKTKRSKEQASTENEWKAIADRLSAAGWTWGCTERVDSDGKTTFVADAHRSDGQRFIVRTDSRLAAFVELQRQVRTESANDSPAPPPTTPSKSPRKRPLILDLRRIALGVLILSFVVLGIWQPYEHSLRRAVGDARTTAQAVSPAQAEPEIRKAIPVRESDLSAGAPVPAQIPQTLDIIQKASGPRHTAIVQPRTADEPTIKERVNKAAERGEEWGKEGERSSITRGTLQSPEPWVEIAPKLEPVSKDPWAPPKANNPNYLKTLEDGVTETASKPEHDIAGHRLWFVRIYRRGVFVGYGTRMETPDGYTLTPTWGEILDNKDWLIEAKKRSEEWGNPR